VTTQPGSPVVTPEEDAEAVPLVELRDINVSFGGVRAVRDASIKLFPGEVIGVVGHNGAGKTTLMKVLSGAQPADSGEILIDGKPATIRNPRDAKNYAIETIYQSLALAENLDAPGNLFLGRERTTLLGQLDDSSMESETRTIMRRLNPNFTRFRQPVVTLSGGQRQAIAIARAVYFNARILIMDEPTAALGPNETAQVHSLVHQLKSEGIGIFLISHDIHDVFDLSDRISVMYQGRIIQTVKRDEVTTDDVLSMIIVGQHPGTAKAAPAAAPAAPPAAPAAPTA
jgi:D-xylose transport system ATP-binding protein